MALAAMRYKNYTWPNNPEVYSIRFERSVAARKVPFGRYLLQDLGLTRRVMKGEGAFYGKTAYEEFKKLAAVFYDEGPGVLVHPVWQAANVYFVDLSLAQEPKKDYVRYTFTFWESFDSYQTGPRVQSQGQTETGGQTAAFHTVVGGESLWSVARDAGVGLTALIALNPQIKNPNSVRAGERVRLK